MSALDQLGAALGGPGGPPTHIPLPGGGGGPDMMGAGAGPQPGPGGAAPGGGIPGPDTPKVADAVQSAIDSLQGALPQEGDATDKAFIAKIIADLHKFLGDQQKLQDTAMGAGPGAKMVRKAASPGY